MGIFLKTQGLMNKQTNLYWQLSQCAYMDGHGYVREYAVVNGKDEFATVVRRYYTGFKFDDTNSPVTTFSQPTSTGRARAVTSTDGVDVMTSGGEDTSGSNLAIVEQWRADDSTVITKTMSPTLTEGRELGVGTASYHNSHFHIGGQRSSSNTQTNIDAINYLASAQTISQGNMSTSGRNSTGCGNGYAAFYRHQDDSFQSLEVINISDHTAGAGTSFISQPKTSTSLVSIVQLGSAVSTGPDAVFIGGIQITAIPFDDTGVEATWPVSLASNHNRGGAATDGDTIVLTGGLNTATDTIRYIQANNISTLVTASSQSLPLAVKQHSMIAYQ